MKRLKLVAAEYCPFSLRCLLALKEKCLEFDLVYVDLSDKAAISQPLSPYGRVPLLQHGDAFICESSIINEYLEEICPAPALLPKEPLLRATARFWIDFSNTRFMPAYFNLLKSAPGAQRDRLREELLGHLAFIDEKGLGAPDRDGPYWTGETLGLVDLAFYPFFERFADVEVYRGVVIPPSLKRLQDWLVALRAHPTVKALAKPRAHYVDYFRKFYAD
jgi:glutathione S-transferase